MKKIKITTPENIEIEVVLAEALSRCGAVMIDSLIQLALCVVIACLALPAIGYLGDLEKSNYVGWLIGGLIIVELLVVYAYFIVSEIFMQGQTFGKKVMHLRSIRTNGGPMTMKHILIRNLFRVFVDNFGLGVLFMFFHKTNKRVGDLVAGTMVVIEEKQTMPKALDTFITLDEELRAYFTGEELAILRDYFNRKEEMINYEDLRREMYLYFKMRLEELGLYEKHKGFVETL